MEEELGFWNFVHGTGAGCASALAWEGTRLLFEGGAALAVFAAVTVGIMHLVHRHRRHLQRKVRARHGHRHRVHGVVLR